MAKNQEQIRNELISKLNVHTNCHRKHGDCLPLNELEMFARLKNWVRYRLREVYKLEQLEILQIEEVLDHIASQPLGMSTKISSRAEAAENLVAYFNNPEDPIHAKRSEETSNRYRLQINSALVRVTA